MKMSFSWYNVTMITQSMDALALKLNPISRLKIYLAVRKIVLVKMNGNIITPERAMEIIGYTKAEVVKVQNADEALRFSADLAGKFPELGGLESAFEMETVEQYDRVITKMVDRFMERDEVNTVDEILERMKSSASESAKRGLLADLERKYPEDYESALTNIIESQK
jgi:hypothetical protein